MVHMKNLYGLAVFLGLVSALGVDQAHSRDILDVEDDGNYYFIDESNHLRVGQCPEELGDSVPNRKNCYQDQPSCRVGKFHYFKVVEPVVKKALKEKEGNLLRRWKMTEAKAIDVDVRVIELKSEIASESELVTKLKDKISKSNKLKFELDMELSVHEGNLEDHKQVLKKTKKYLESNPLDSAMMKQKRFQEKKIKELEDKVSSTSAKLDTLDEKLAEFAANLQKHEGNRDTAQTKLLEMTENYLPLEDNEFYSNWVERKQDFEFFQRVKAGGLKGVEDYLRQEGIPLQADFLDSFQSDFFRHFLVPAIEKLMKEERHTSRFRNCGLKVVAQRPFSKRVESIKKWLMKEDGCVDFVTPKILKKNSPEGLKLVVVDDLVGWKKNQSDVLAEKVQSGAALFLTKNGPFLKSILPDIVFSDAPVFPFKKTNHIPGNIDVEMLPELSDEVVDLQVRWLPEKSKIWFASKEKFGFYWSPIAVLPLGKGVIHYFGADLEKVILGKSDPAKIWKKIASNQIEALNIAARI